ncbi:hypothetical protein AGABI1DRAFT_76921 [Agaricus bisporus var. burnettii JB137-S8]|uniref:PH domain-containing protein n=1 Tax=Agaricus bisporus var. burnettii (strain JB137-S8 / ATCC MYA-4627 / FGSC 10392) TaxID=597362 RepID=K5X3F6_AGABU|nr:uncharacterized protein AGABI1DRAFT_76921 [Agaricus bisporus var. burnettii JB137-S8]EKM77467.1 hypothetical protein AGABI1DRAFT_76921 [Agaricus bisporus var. burnettii JB137-S8]
MEAVYQVKLLAALRSGDPARIHPFLAEIGKDRSVSSLDCSAAALHLAVRCASTETVALLLAHRAISPNGVHPPASGTTPLHLAASLGRVDIVTLLLDQDGIDDTLLDDQRKSCRDLAKTRDTLKAIDDSRTLLNASYRSLLRSYILSPFTDPPSPALLHLLSGPRTSLINLSYLDDDSGSSLLHEAANRKDLRLIELAVRAGADVFVRNRRGKMAYEIVKDDKVKVFLRQFANHDHSFIRSSFSASDPPALKGYLNKYTNVARGYHTRWFVLAHGVLSYYRHQQDESVSSRGSISMKSAIVKINEQHSNRFEIQSRLASASVQKWYIKANHPVEAARWILALNKSIEWARAAPEPPRSSAERSIAESDSIHAALSTDPNLSDLNPDDDEEEGTRMPTDDASSMGMVSRHDDIYELQGNSILAQLEMTQRLLVSYFGGSTSSARSISSTNSTSHEIKSTILESMSTLSTLAQEYTSMSKDREQCFQKALAQEKARQKVWEESLATVVREGATLEEELRNRSRKRGSKIFGPGEGFVAALSGIGEEKESALGVTLVASPPAIDSPWQESPLAEPVRPRTSTSETVKPRQDGDSDEEDEEDEFFDAIDSNNLPHLVVPPSLAIQPPPLSPASIPSFIDMGPYKGYEVLRTKLGLMDDERPPTSLWSVLKHSIGKDLTRISFPVFFNEPTSMLQRMAEDMEFSECLDTAATEMESLKRLAYVAAFAMSNYSSTIGRIAKPFNPMLSETFEYVRLDKKYRYVSEQVSHHPPISACWAESPLWHYFGEVDAQNKFMGKSFEIRPTGVAHAELILPESWVEDKKGYRKAQGVCGGEGKVVEHYTWKKVTTNVSGFILGSPTIDHYGDMTVVNHATNEKCVLTFKPRGWRGKDAYEIAGQVLDAKGRAVYEIAGRWNSQLIMRPVGSGGVLHPDTTVSSSSLDDVELNTTTNNNSPEYILLWKNSPKPIGSPFNLTPFAITLNECSKETLLPFLCPTDCRLRPDQRAFEMGKYDLANELKMKQEERQRGTRKEREMGVRGEHRPRWFEARTDGDTGERVWMPKKEVRRREEEVEYWAERERVWREGGFKRWKDVEEIFVEEPEVLRD